MTYRVQLTAQAEADIDRIFDWLFQRSPEGARRWYEAFWESAERLKSNPLSMRTCPRRRWLPGGSSPDALQDEAGPNLPCLVCDSRGQRAYPLRPRAGRAARAAGRHRAWKYGLIDRECSVATKGQNPNNASLAYLSCGRRQALYWGHPQSSKLWVATSAPTENRKPDQTPQSRPLNFSVSVQWCCSTDCASSWTRRTR